MAMKMVVSVALSIALCASLSSSRMSSGTKLGGIADVMHSDSYGQSLSIGQSTKPAIYSTRALYNNIMFASGPRYTGSESLSAFSPLVEKKQGALGETVVSASLNHTVQLIATENGHASTEHEGVFLGSASGVGGYGIKQLAKGTPPYQNLLALVARARSLTRVEGKSYAYIDTTWTQGETDQASNVSRAAYLAKITTLKRDLQTDVTAISGQSFEPLFLTAQPASHIWFHNRPSGPKGPAAPNIALALRDLAIAGDARIAAPMYMMEYADQVHLRSVWYQVLGAYYGRLRKRLMDDREAGRPLGLHRLDVKSIAWTGRVIDIVLNVPVPPIVIDTHLVAPTVNYGFDLWDSSGNLVDTITSVAVDGPDRIRIVCSEVPPSGTRLTNAWGRPGDVAKSGRIEGPRSNIRDSEGDIDQIVDGTGITRPLHNWLVILDAVKP